MKQLVYISEPQEINGEAKKLIASGYKILRGDPDLNLNYSSDIQTLLIRSYTKVDQSLLTKLPNLKNIVRVGVGLDHIDLSLCKSLGIKIYNSAGANSNAVSEYVVCLLLTALRKINLLNTKDLIAWNRFKFMGTELKDQTIGLIGFGNIAKLVYKKLSAFECKKFLVYDPFVSPDLYTSENITFCSLDYLLKNSNVISLHIPLTDATHHLINEKNLNKLKKGTILINTSRGSIVSEKSVIEDTAKGKIFYIADVFETEPKVKKLLIKQKNFIGSPHIASMTVEANKKMVTTAFDNFIEGRCVNLE